MHACMHACRLACCSSDRYSASAGTRLGCPMMPAHSLYCPKRADWKDGMSGTVYGPACGGSYVGFQESVRQARHIT
jgi:hypothetical protein